MTSVIAAAFVVVAVPVFAGVGVSVYLSRRLAKRINNEGERL